MFELVGDAHFVYEPGYERPLKKKMDFRLKQCGWKLKNHMDPRLPQWVVDDESSLVFTKTTPNSDKLLIVLHTDPPEPNFIFDKAFSLMAYKHVSEEKIELLRFDWVGFMSEFLDFMQKVKAIESKCSKTDEPQKKAKALRLERKAAKKERAKALLEEVALKILIRDGKESFFPELRDRREDIEYDRFHVLKRGTKFNSKPEAVEYFKQKSISDLKNAKIEVAKRMGWTELAMALQTESKEASTTVPDSKLKRDAPLAAQSDIPPVGTPEYIEYTRKLVEKMNSMAKSKEHQAPVACENGACGAAPDQSSMKVKEPLVKKGFLNRKK